MVLKFNQTNCIYDTISSFYNPDYEIYFIQRGITSTCDYFVCNVSSANGNGILFMGLNQDTVFIDSCYFPDNFMFIEYEYNPSDNCLYVLGGVNPSLSSFGVYRCNLATGQFNLLTALPEDYGVLWTGHCGMCTIDVDSNFMYCSNTQKIAKINLNNGNVDTLSIYNPGDSINNCIGLFFDQDRRIIIGVWTDMSLTHTHLIYYNPITNEKNIFGTLLKKVSTDWGFAYDDENDIYLTYYNDYVNKYYFYNSLDGTFIDSCTTSEIVTVDNFYQKCNNSIGIEEKSQPPNIKVYPTIADDCLYIDLESDTKKMHYNIYDNTGRIISTGKEINIISNPVKIKLPELVQGYYCIQIWTEKTLQSFKFLKLNTE